jgi:hypothetical protein
VKTKNLSGRFPWAHASIITSTLTVLAILFGCADTELAGPNQLATTDSDNVGQQQPYTYQLYQNYPNPFNPSTTIRFDLGQPGDATLTIYNEAGGVVWSHFYEGLEAGPQTEHWNGMDNNGNPAASGVYIYELTAGSFSDSKKMVLLL